MTKRNTAINANAEAATRSLATQANNVGKGFDVTKIDTIDPQIIEQLLAVNDLSVLTSAQRVKLIKMLCESLGLNPLTRPLQFVEFKSADGDGNNEAKKKLSIYATKECTEQLRKIHGVSVEDLKREVVENICIVTAYVQDKTGRKDTSTGAVPLEKPGKAPYMWNNVQQPGYAATPFDSLQKANAIMKCETKAKRRATLSICGLGFLDETQIEDLLEPKIIEVNITEEDLQKDQAEQAKIKATEEEMFLQSMELSTEIKEAVAGAKTKQELTAVHDKYIESLSEDLKVIFKGECTKRKIEINRETVSTDMKTAAQAEDKSTAPATGGGLFRKKQTA